jgi:hypothetical protein
MMMLPVAGRETLAADIARTAVGCLYATRT